MGVSIAPWHTALIRNATPRIVHGGTLCQPNSGGVAVGKKAQESAEALLQGPFLIEAQKWFDQRSQDLSDPERKFISASREVRERLAREPKKRHEREIEAAQSLATIYFAHRIMNYLAHQELSGVSEDLYTWPTTDAPALPLRTLVGTMRELISRILSMG
jgi:hypothetical protein